MSDLRIVEVDPFDDDLFQRWHDAYSESQRHGREATATLWTAPELRAMLREPSGRKWRQGYAVLAGDRVVGTGFVATSLVDNLDAAEVAVDTLPSERGRGIATALLAHLENVCRARGRTVLQAEVAWPYDAHSHGAGQCDVEFALSRGFTLGLLDIQRVLRLPVADDLLDRLEVSAAPRHASYDVRAWVGRVPDDLVDGWAALSATLMTEAPVGEMEREAEVIDAASVREAEALVEKQGRTKYNAVALAPDGAVVAYSDVVTTIHEPGRAYQWGTLVHADHRGHRLGMAVKLANIRLLQAERPDIERIVTWNAEVNAHMVGVNVELGFVPQERLGELQKRLAHPRGPGVVR